MKDYSVLAAKFVWFLFILTLILTSWQWIISMHEEGHRIINSNHNINSHIEISNFGFSGKTIPDYNACSQKFADCSGDVIAQSNYEGFAYTIIPCFMITSIFLGIIVFFIGLLFLENKLGDKK